MVNIFRCCLKFFPGVLDTHTSWYKMYHNLISAYVMHCTSMHIKMSILQIRLQLCSFPAVATIGGALFVLQQLAGINGVLYFSSLTFKDVGISSSALASLFVGLTNFAGM